MNNNGTDITKAYHNGIEITAIMLNGVDVGAFTPPGPPAYQPWENYPDSPVLTEDYPHQLLFAYASGYRLFCSASPLCKTGSNGICPAQQSSFKYYGLVSGNWSLYSEGIATPNVAEANYTTLLQANSDFYTNVNMLYVQFSKTTA